MKWRWLVYGLSGLLLAALPATSRTWNPKAAGLAQDYSMIVDNKPNREVSILFWISSPLLGSSPTAQAVLDKYVILGALHGQGSVGGGMDFDPQPTLQAKDEDGADLKPIMGDVIPPTVQAIIAGMGGVMRQSLGAMGQGMHFFVFEAGNVRACSKGRLSVPFAGTVYTYDTPIPGCPAP